MTSDIAAAKTRFQDAASGQAWLLALHGAPGPFLGFVLDSVEVTDERIATISHRLSATTGTPRSRARAITASVSGA